MDLVGGLVRLRGLRPEDAQAFAAIAADPEVVRYLGPWSWNPTTVFDHADYINRRDPGQIKWAVECIEDGALIGSTDLRDLDFRNRHCWWGIMIGPPERWDRGYGTEACRLCIAFAFKQLGMEKVYLHVHEGNERGRRAYEKAGFVVEGTLPRNVWIDGDLRATYLMAAYCEGDGEHG